MAEVVPSSQERSPAAAALRSSAVTATAYSQGEVVPDPNEIAQWGNRVIKADQAHQYTDGDASVTIGIADSGIARHNELTGKYDEARSVDCSNAGVPVTGEGAWEDRAGHGTAVADVAAARRDGFAMVGVAPNARVASLRVGNSAAEIFPESAVCAYMWAGRHQFPIVNSSFTLDPWGVYCDTDPDQSAVITAVNRSIRWSRKQGVIHVVAAGNDAYDLKLKGPYYDQQAHVYRDLAPSCKALPAEAPGVVVVAGLELDPSENVRQYSHSNRGLGVIDVAAPAKAIYTFDGSRYAKLSGTSFAAPHVAGVLALLKSTHPKNSSKQLERRLLSQADPIPCLAPELTSGPLCVGTLEMNSFAGHGIVDALDAVTLK